MDSLKACTPHLFVFVWFLSWLVLRAGRSSQALLSHSCAGRPWLAGARKLVLITNTLKIAGLATAANESQSHAAVSPAAAQYALPPFTADKEAEQPSSLS